MKQFLLFFTGLFSLLSVAAQYNSKATKANKANVTITVYGNTNPQISVDGKIYTQYDNTVQGANTSIEIKALETGQHTLEITNPNQYSKRSEKVSTSFTLRRRYDMTINLNSNGSLELIEKMKFRNDDVTNPPMSNANFTNLLNNVKKQRSTSGKRSAITTALNTPNNYFSTSQVVQLLQQVNSEAYRLELAKLSYRTVTDQEKFTQVFALLNSQQSRDELEAFVYADYDDESQATAMADAAFNNLFENIKQQWPVSTQMNSLTAAFNNPNNYFTAFQAGKLIQIVTGESNRLQLAKLSYGRITDRGNFYQVSDLLAYQSSKNELAAYIANYSGEIKVGMADSDFNTLYQDIKQQWPVSTQMNSLTSAFNNPNNYFTAFQAGKLIQIVTAESNRLQLAKLSYRSIADPTNFYQVADILAYPSSKNELAAYINNYNGGSGTVRVPMSDADFSELVRNIQFQFFPGAKMSALTDAFNNSNYYFTSEQAKQLIEFVSLESNRLELAKLSYRTITDRANFSIVYEVLSSQSSRDELASYVNLYKE